MNLVLCVGRSVPTDQEPGGSLLICIFVADSGQDGTIKTFLYLRSSHYMAIEERLP